MSSLSPLLLALQVPSAAFYLGGGLVVLCGGVVIWLALQRRAALREVEELRDLRRLLEERTEELAEANQHLEEEIVEKRMASEALRMLERAVEQSKDGIAVIDLGGSTQFVNEAWARMHGYEVPEVLGHHLSLFHTPDQMEEQVEPFLDRARESDAGEGEVWHRRKNGSIFPTRMSCTLLRDQAENASGFVAFARDVTESRRADEERLRLEDRVRQSEKLQSLGILAGGIAHDFNNLLTGILGNAGLLLKELPEDADQRTSGRLRQIETASERAAELTDQLLAYAGEDQLIVRPTQVNEVVEGMEVGFREAVPEEIELRLHLSRHLQRIEANAGQLRQVLDALVINAVEALADTGESRERRGEIIVRTGHINATKEQLLDAVFDDGLSPGSYIFVSVTDNGCGMDSETRAKMFDPFFSTKFTGRGLGLAAVLGLIRGHSGTIKVQSEPHRGTTVELWFPALREGAPEPPPQPVIEPENLDQWRSSGVVLVVDNEKIMRVVAKSILERHGFDVLTANDGREAVGTFSKERHRIKLVLLDLTMPEMDGVEAFREIRKLDPHAQVILMTGYKEQEVRPGFEGRGLAGFIQKPFRPEELIHAVRDVIDS